MKKHYFMGIDVAKATLDFCLLSKNATLLWRGQLPNESPAIAQFLTELKARGYILAQIHFCCESTGVYAQRLVEALHQSALALSIINPAQIKFFAISVLRRTKNDKVDAQIIARFCRERQPLATRPLRPIEAQLKLLVHERESRVNEQNRERNRAKTDPHQIELPKLIEQQRKSRLKQLAKEIAQFDAAIGSLIASDECFKNQSRLLCSIPGIAEVTAAKLLSELAGKEFHSARQLAAYAGLTPQECRSGYRSYGKTVLCKIGNRFLRRALFLPAAVARRWCKPLQPWIAQLQSRKLHALAIRGALMRKLLHIVFGVLAHQQPFNPSLVYLPNTP
jgi:transposase